MLQALFALRLGLTAANALHASDVARNETRRLGTELILVHSRHDKACDPRWSSFDRARHLQSARR